MRNAPIDRLRGVAILTVLIGHSPRFIGQWQPALPFFIHEHIVTGVYYGVRVPTPLAPGHSVATKIALPPLQLEAGLQRVVVKHLYRIQGPLAEIPP